MDLGQQIATGNTAELYLKGEVVIKLYFANLPQDLAKREAQKQRLAVERGLPAPRVISVERLHGRQALLMEAVQGRPLAELMERQPQRRLEWLRDAVALQRRICSEAGDGSDPLKSVLESAILRVGALSESERSGLLERLRRLPDQNLLCHGDFHPLNILVTERGYTVIDWCNLACCDPAADLCRSYLTCLLHANELAEPYLTLACGEFQREKKAVLEWMPVMAAIFISESAHAPHRDRLLQLARG